MTRLFGTDGIRGRAGQFPLDAATIEVLGASVARQLQILTSKSEPVIVIGRDTRESGSWIERAFCAGAVRAGASCHSAGVITTPGVAFLARTLPADAGVVISASHNPYQDNGIKIFSPSGKKLDDAVERLIEADLNNPSAAHEHCGEASAPVRSSESQELQKRYLDFLSEEIARDLNLTNLKIVVDCANGAASDLAPELFRRLGATIIAINNKPDGRNINYNCGSLHIEGLQKTVVEEGADFGVAFDGDADRALFVDSRGTFVDGDATLWVLAKNLQNRGKLNHGIVVATVMSNIGLEIALQSKGIRLVRKDVGDKYVLEELLRSGTSLGGEQSGHVILPELSLAGDGMITTLCLLRAMADEGQPLDRLIEGFKRYPQVLVNVSVTEKPPFEQLPDVQKTAKEIESLLGDRGRLLLRYSGTERLARVMIEGENQALIDEQANRLAQAIKDAIGVEVWTNQQ